jgi:sterol desaturase/sphingolipid hydroxylase (fatty acid hydroxylase superfamily)
MQTAYKSITLFKNPILERFSHIHPISPLVVWGPVSAWLIWRSMAVLGLEMGTLLVMATAGLLFWTLSEYVLHRFVFHFNGKGEFQERILFILHGIHHADPVDPTRLVMPPLVSIMMAMVLYPLFRMVLGNTLVQPFFGFFLIGYLIYDYTHYAVHHFTPRTRVGKYLKQSHMIHHYVNHDLRWGVSTTLWDHVFGTYRENAPAKNPGRKPKVRPATDAGLVKHGS